MQKTKRKGRGKNITRVSKKQNASKSVHKQCIALEDGSSNLVESCGYSSSELTKQIESKLSESVVSLASFDGDTVVSECTGIFIENLCADATTILTTANLGRSLHDGFAKKLTIKVRLPNDRVVIGSLGQTDLKYDLAVVKIRRARGFQEAHLSSSHRVLFESDSKVVAVGRCFNSGMLRFTNGTVIGSASYETRELILPTCEMNTALNGCPLIDFDGNFVGVNFRCGKPTVFVPMNKILEFLGYCGTTRHSTADIEDEPDSNRHSAADTNDKHGLNRNVLNDNWSMLYGDAEADRDLDLFPLGECAFVYKKEDLSASIYC